MNDYDSTGDVRAHQFRVAQLLMAAAQNILQRAIDHDASKLESIEKDIFDQVLPELKNTTFGTPEYKEQTARLGEALQHHYAVNAHHPQYHADGVNDMSLLDQLEMLADWKAAGERGKGGNGGSLQRSLDYHRDQGTISEQQWRTLTTTAAALQWL